VCNFKTELDDDGEPQQTHTGPSRLQDEAYQAFNKADEVRAKLVKFLEETGAFQVTHTRQDKRKLATHLLGTYDLLKARCCSADVCLAGGLHSIYGTNRFRVVSVAPTEDRRAKVSAVFGLRAEHLAFLFHVCNRPRDLERGLLCDRHTDPPKELQVSIQDLRDLRLIEGANLLDQSADMLRFPRILRVWNQHANAQNLKAVDLRLAQQQQQQQCAPSRMQVACALLSRFRLVSPPVPPVHGVRLRSGTHTTFMPLPVDTAKFADFLLAACGKAGATRNSLKGFVLAGEGDFGMPPAPLEMLNSFKNCPCAGAEVDMVALEVLEVEAVLAKQIHVETSSQPSLFPAVPLSALRAREETAISALVMALEEQGWASIAVEADKVQAMQASFEATRRLVDIDDEDKSSWKTRFDGARYTGFATDAGREWLQMRTGAMTWPSAALPLRETFELAFQAADDVARQACGAVLQHYKLSESNPLDILLDGPRESQGGFGASVMRFFAYREKIGPTGRQGSWGSSPHADMGLVTVSSPSTMPALELWNPRTGHRQTPESHLKEHEWLVFPGETLSFLTGGALPAPIHGVPARVEIADNGTGSGAATDHGRRCSAPFFLRAAPEAALSPLTKDELPGTLTCREFMTKHSVGLRPWRVRRDGADW